MDCFASLAMTTGYAFAFSRRFAPEVMRWRCPRNRRGRRESRVPSAPAIVRKEMHTGDRKVRRNTRPSLRNGFTAYGALSPEPNSFGLRRCRIGD
jgi:hypothetical protein